MVKEFLQIHIQDGKLDSSVNRKIFEQTEIITYKDTVNRHMGQHPIIHVNFKGGEVSSYEDAIAHCRKVVHQAFSEHNFLLNSTKLHSDTTINATCQSICRKWCDDTIYKMQEVNDVKSSLFELAQFLYSHFDKQKVYLLVDEFDAVNTNAFFGVKEKDPEKKKEQLQRINNFVAAMLTNLIKPDALHKYVGGALVTGVSYIAGLGFSPLLNNLYHIRFLDARKVDDAKDQGPVAFYGALKEEIESVVARLVKGKHLTNFEGKSMYTREDGSLDEGKIMETINSHYNDYFDGEGQRLNCLWFLLQFLNSGHARYYWKQTDGFRGLHVILRNGEISKDILKLLNGESVNFNYLDKLDIDDILELFYLIFNKQPSCADRNVVFSFLVEQDFSLALLKRMLKRQS